MSWTTLSSQRITAATTHSSDLTCEMFLLVHSPQCALHKYPDSMLENQWVKITLCRTLFICSAHSGGINNINNDYSIPFRWATSRALLMCLLGLLMESSYHYCYLQLCFAALSAVKTPFLYERRVRGKQKKYEAIWEQRYGSVLYLILHHNMSNIPVKIFQLL